MDTANELGAYLGRQVGHGRLTVLSQEYARKVGDSWLKQYRAGLSEGERQRLLDEALLNLVGAQHTDDMLAVRLSTGLGTGRWIGYRTIMPGSHVDVARQIEHANHVRQGRRMVVPAINARLMEAGVTAGLALLVGVCVRRQLLSSPMGFGERWLSHALSASGLLASAATYGWYLFRGRKPVLQQVIPEA